MSTRTQAAGGYRLKPAPRSRSGGGSSRVQWDRVGRIALVFVLVAILASYIGPSLKFVDAWRDSKAEHASLADLRTENAKLKQRLATLDGPDAAERGARKIGMVDEGNGEAAYVIRGLNH